MFIVSQCFLLNYTFWYWFLYMYVLLGVIFTIKWRFFDKCINPTAHWITWVGIWPWCIYEDGL